MLSPNSNLSLVSHLDTPTFYQTLAGVTHCRNCYSRWTRFNSLFFSVSEQEIMELEKKFWSLVGNSSSGRIDLSIITPLVSPPLPPKLVSGLFKAFDENQDGHVDFKELACGVSASCRGPDMERQKCESSVLSHLQFILTGIHHRFNLNLKVKKIYPISM